MPVTHPETTCRTASPRRGRSRSESLLLAAPGSGREHLPAPSWTPCSQGGSTLVSSAPPTLKIASPEQPGHLADLRRQPGRSPTACTRRRTPRCGSTTTPTTSTPTPIKSFEKKYAGQGQGQVSTFNDTDEALTKIRGGNVAFDIYFPSYDQISKMVTAKLIRPLNHSLHPEHHERLAEFTNPWYDRELAVHGPYTVYTTGIGWRTDKVTDDIGALTNPYEASGTRSTRARSRSSTTGTPPWPWCCCARESPTSTRPTRRPARWSATSSTAMDDATTPKVTITMYNDLPAGQLGDVPDVVGRRRQRACPTCRRAPRRGAALLVPGRRQGRGRQRPDRHPARAARTR